jgi:AcrR family transcriptional regulator
MTTAEIKAVGRPRDESRDAAILDATLTVLSDVGYDRLTIDAVATAAKASKATVYRRWPGKAALVVDAIQTINPIKPTPPGQMPDCHWPDTGSLRGDLIAGCQNFVERLSSEEGKLMLAVMTAQAHDPELAAAMRAATYDDKRRSCRTLADRAVARGELTSTTGTDTFTEVLPAVIFNRLLLSDEGFDDAFITHVVDDIALPLLGYHQASTPRGETT